MTEHCIFCYKVFPVTLSGYEADLTCDECMDFQKERLEKQRKEEEELNKPKCSICGRKDGLDYNFILGEHRCETHWVNKES